MNHDAASSAVLTHAHAVDVRREPNGDLVLQVIDGPDGLRPGQHRRVRVSRALETALGRDDVGRELEETRRTLATLVAERDKLVDDLARLAAHLDDQHPTPFGSTVSSAVSDAIAALDNLCKPVDAAPPTVDQHARAMREGNLRKMADVRDACIVEMPGQVLVIVDTCNRLPLSEYNQQVALAQLGIAPGVTVRFATFPEAWAALTVATPAATIHPKMAAWDRVVDAAANLYPERLVDDAHSLISLLVAGKTNTQAWAMVRDAVLSDRHLRFPEDVVKAYAAECTKATEAEARANATISDLNAAYTERTRLIASLAGLAMFLGERVGLGQHDPKDQAWNPAWRTVVFVELPDGKGGVFQASWHIADTDRHLVAHLPDYEGTWDGHSTTWKHERMEVTSDPRAWPIVGRLRAQLPAGQTPSPNERKEAWAKLITVLAMERAQIDTTVAALVTP